MSEDNSNAKTEKSEEENEAKEESEKEDSDEMDSNDMATHVVDSLSTKDEEKDDELEKNEGKEKPIKKKYNNWPLREIKEPHENDVLYGRGGGTNHRKLQNYFCRVVFTAATIPKGMVRNSI